MLLSFLHCLPLLAMMAAAPVLLFRVYRGVSLATVNVQAGTLPTGAIFSVPQYEGAHGPLQVAWDVIFAGTALGSVNVRLEGTNIDNPQSAAASAWADADDSTAVGGESRTLVNKEFKFWRVRVTAATGGDATSFITAGIKFN